jgi:hypothetical protein
MKNKKALCLRVHNASDGGYAKIWKQWINVSKPADASFWHIQRQEGPAVIWNHHYIRLHHRRFGDIYRRRFLPLGTHITQI